MAGRQRSPAWSATGWRVPREFVRGSSRQYSRERCFAVDGGWPGSDPAAVCPASMVRSGRDDRPGPATSSGARGIALDLHGLPARGRCRCGARSATGPRSEPMPPITGLPVTPTQAHQGGHHPQLMALPESTGRVAGGPRGESNSATTGRSHLDDKPSTRHSVTTVDCSSKRSFHRVATAMHEIGWYFATVDQARTARVGASRTPSHLPSSSLFLQRRAACFRLAARFRGIRYARRSHPHPGHDPHGGAELRRRCRCRGAHRPALRPGRPSVLRRQTPPPRRLRPGHRAVSSTRWRGRTASELIRLPAACTAAACSWRSAVAS